MHGRVFLAIAAAATAACSHAAMSDSPTVTCSVGAFAGRPAGLTGDQACAIVRERVGSGVAASGDAPAPAIAIVLDLSRSGSAIARIRYTRAGGAESSHELAVDVMDRALVRDDIVRLADTVTQTIVSEMQRS